MTENRDIFNEDNLWAVERVLKKDVNAKRTTQFKKNHNA